MTDWALFQKEFVSLCLLNFALVFFFLLFRHPVCAKEVLGLDVVVAISVNYFIDTLPDHYSFLQTPNVDGVFTMIFIDFGGIKFFVASTVYSLTPKNREKKPLWHSSVFTMGFKL